jgi:hypothetical protein
MPGYDGTGPVGMGPMTGGGRGYCAVGGADFYARPRAGSFLRRGGGRGRRNMYYATGSTGWQRSGYPYAEPSAFEEKNILKSEAEAMKRDLEAIQRRIQTLEKDQNQG